jgi:hypothetical protein
VDGGEPERQDDCKDASLALDGVLNDSLLLQLPVTEARLLN